MNWKMIVGALLAYGAASETLSIIRDHNAGKVTFYPGGLFFGAVMVGAALYLFYKGWQQRNN